MAEVRQDTGGSLDDLSFERCHKRNIYHRQAMEIRRSIQMKVFTGSIVLLLGLAKVGYDILNCEGATVEIRTVLIGAAFAVPAFLFFFMLQIEFVNKKNREWYLYYERLLDSNLAGAGGNVPKSPQSEPLYKSLFLSWAGTWPVLSTLFLAVLIFCAFKSVQIKEPQSNLDRRVPVEERLNDSDTDTGPN